MFCTSNPTKKMEIEKAIGGWFVIKFLGDDKN